MCQLYIQSIQLQQNQGIHLGPHSHLHHLHAPEYFAADTRNLPSPGPLDSPAVPRVEGYKMAGRRYRKLGLTSRAGPIGSPFGCLSAGEGILFGANSVPGGCMGVFTLTNGWIQSIYATGSGTGTMYPPGDGCIFSTYISSSRPSKPKDFTHFISRLILYFFFPAQPIGKLAALIVMVIR